ncbi:MAG: ABC transporter substrate-binding protein, partial [Thermoleophilaceae bacterium]
MSVRVVTVTLALAVATAGAGAAVSQPAATTTQAQGGKLTVLAAGDVDSIDPGIAYYTFGGMVSIATQRPLLGSPPTAGSGIVPDLATELPQVSPDGLTVTVHIKRGVRFSPPVNREVTSRDVKYAIERGFFNTVPNGYADLYFRDLVGARPGAPPGTTIAGLETPDDQTLVLRLAKPRGGLVASALVMSLTAPVPPDYAAAFDRKNPSTYGSHEVATGPYMVENDAQGNTVGYRPGKSIHLVRNPNWDPTTDYRPARLDDIAIREGNTNTDRASRRILSGSGLVSGDYSPPATVLRSEVRAHSDQFAFTAEGGVNFAPLNTKLRPFTNVNVRRAVVAGFDRAAFLRLAGGRLAGVLGTHFIPPGLPGFQEAGGFSASGLKLYAKPHGDLRLAAAYFRRAGFRSGRYEGRRQLSVLTSSDNVGVVLGRSVRRSLQRLGFRLRVRAVSFDRMLDICSKPSSKIHMCPFFGWYRDFPDAETVIDPLFNGANIRKAGNNNWAQLDVPRINQAIESAKALIDPQARAQAWAAIDKQLVDLAPGVVMFYPKWGSTRSADVEGEVNRLLGGLWDLSFVSRRA